MAPDPRVRTCARPGESRRREACLQAAREVHHRNRCAARAAVNGTQDAGQTDDRTGSDCDVTVLCVTKRAFVLPDVIDNVERQALDGIRLLVV